MRRHGFSRSPRSTVLAAVSSLVDANNHVVFFCAEKTGEVISFVTNKTTGHSMRTRRERNVRVFNTCVEEEVVDMNPNNDLELPVTIRLQPELDKSR